MWHRAGSMPQGSTLGARHLSNWGVQLVAMANLVSTAIPNLFILFD